MDNDVFYNPTKVIFGKGTEPVSYTHLEGFFEMGHMLSRSGSRGWNRWLCFLHPD